MNAYKWKYRPLLVFAQSASINALTGQRAIINEKQAGVQERDMVVVYVVGATVETDFGPGPGRSASSLRRRYGIKDGDFTVILVGKDGGAKLRKNQPISTATLFGVIDAMPMRRNEMRGK